MSGEGGEGDESGGGGKGGGGDSGGGHDGGGYYSGDQWMSDSGSNSYAADPGANTGAIDAGNGSTAASFFDGIVNDPSQGNLTGPGPVGGDSGLPGAGGGTNTPFDLGGSGSPWDNLPNLGGIDPSSFSGASSGAPLAADGVFTQGQDAGSTGSGSGILLDSGGTTPGASAASFAAPSGATGGSPDLSGLDQAQHDVAQQYATDTGAALVRDPITGAGPGSSTATDISSAGKAGTGSGSSGSGGSNGNILDSLGIKNPLGVAAAGAGLLTNLAKGNTPPPQYGNLNEAAGTAKGVAAQQTSAGQALQQWQTTGTLPASYESQVQQAANAAKQRAISNAAAQGLPTDPTLNTTLAQNLQAIDAAIPQQREQIAAQLAQSGTQMINAGLQATGVSSDVYKTLANLETGQNAARGAAIANFASSLNGGANKGVTVNLGKAA